MSHVLQNVYFKIVFMTYAKGWTTTKILSTINRADFGWRGDFERRGDFEHFVMGILGILIIAF